MFGRARRNGAVLRASKSRELLAEDVGGKYLMVPRENYSYRRGATLSRTRPCYNHSEAERTWGKYPNISLRLPASLPSVPPIG